MQLAACVVVVLLVAAVASAALNPALDFLRPPTLLADLNTEVLGLQSGVGDAGRSERIRFNGLVYFPAADNTYGVELFSTDGFSQSLVVDEAPGLASSFPSSLTVFGGRLFWLTSMGAIRSLGTDGSVLAHSTGFRASGTLIVAGPRMYVTVLSTTAGAELAVLDASQPLQPLQVVDICPEISAPEVFGIQTVVSVPCSSSPDILATDGAGGVWIWACPSWTASTEPECLHNTLGLLGADRQLRFFDLVEASPNDFDASDCVQTMGGVFFRPLTLPSPTPGNIFVGSTDPLRPFFCEFTTNATNVVLAAPTGITPYSALPTTLPLPQLLAPLNTSTDGILPRVEAMVPLPFPTDAALVPLAQVPIMGSYLNDDLSTTMHVFVFDSPTRSFAYLGPFFNINSTNPILDIGKLRPTFSPFPNVGALVAFDTTTYRSVLITPSSMSTVIDSGAPLMCPWCAVVPLTASMVAVYSPTTFTSSSNMGPPRYLDQLNNGLSSSPVFANGEQILDCWPPSYVPVAPGDSVPLPLGAELWATGRTPLLGLQVVAYQDPRALNASAAFRITQSGLRTDSSSPAHFIPLSRSLVFSTAQSTYPTGLGSTPLNQSVAQTQIWSTSSSVGLPTLLQSLTLSEEVEDAIAVSAGADSEGVLLRILTNYPEPPTRRLVYVDAVTGAVAPVDTLTVVSTSYAPLRIVSLLSFRLSTLPAPPVSGRSPAQPPAPTAFLTLLDTPVSDDPVPPALPQSLMLLTTFSSPGATSTVAITDAAFSSTLVPGVTSIPRPSFGGGAFPMQIVTVGSFDGFKTPRANTGKTLIVYPVYLSDSAVAIVVSDGVQRWVAAETQPPALPASSGTVCALAAVSGSPFVMLVYGSNLTVSYALLDLSETRPAAPAASLKVVLSTQASIMDVVDSVPPMWWNSRRRSGADIKGDVVVFRAGLPVVRQDTGATAIVFHSFVVSPSSNKPASMLSPPGQTTTLTYALVPIAVLPPPLSTDAPDEQTSMLVLAGFSSLANALDLADGIASPPATALWTVSPSDIWSLTPTAADAMVSPARIYQIQSVSWNSPSLVVPQPVDRLPVLYVTVSLPAGAALVAFNGLRAEIVAGTSGLASQFSSIGAVVLRGERTPVCLIASGSDLMGTEMFSFLAAAPFSPPIQPPVVAPLNITLNVQPPTTSSGSSGSSRPGVLTESFALLFGVLREVTPDGVVVANASVDASTFNVSSVSVVNDYANVNYTDGLLSNGARLSTYYWFFEYGRTVDFANIMLEFGDRSLKFSFKVAGWPFVSMANRLEVSIDVVADTSTNLCGSSQSSVDDEALVVRLQTEGGLVVTASLALVGLVDNATATILGRTAKVFAPDGVTEVGAALVVSTPAFAHSVLVDPELSFGELIDVVDSDADYVEQQCRGGGGNKFTTDELVLSIVLPVGVCLCCLLVVGLMVVLLLVRRTQLADPLFRWISPEDKQLMRELRQHNARRSSPQGSPHGSTRGGPRVSSGLIVRPRSGEMSSAPELEL